MTIQWPLMSELFAEYQRDFFFAFFCLLLLIFNSNNSNTTIINNLFFYNFLNNWLFSKSLFHCVLRIIFIHNIKRVVSWSAQISEFYIHIVKQFAFSPLRQQELRSSRRKYLCVSHSKPFNYFGGDDYVLFLKNNNAEYENLCPSSVTNHAKAFCLIMFYILFSTMLHFLFVRRSMLTLLAIISSLPLWIFNNFVETKLCFQSQSYIVRVYLASLNICSLSVVGDYSRIK